jgi:hypothetical protein
MRRRSTKTFTASFAASTVTGLMKQSQDERIFLRVAGIMAILSCGAWLTWAVLNGITHGGMERVAPPSSARLLKLGELLTAAWNLFLVPAALALWRWLEPRRPNLMLLYTASGILSLAFWAYGGATHAITPSLESSYLLMSAVWWTGTGSLLWEESRATGLFTIVLGLFTGLDFAFTLFEPLPDYVFAISAPKLPLAALWSFWIGVTLVRNTTHEQRERSAIAG